MNETRTMIDRIRMNEERLDRCSSALQELEQAVESLCEALAAYRGLQPELAALDAYYGSPAWFTDKETQEAGMLPADLKCGVLSEDAVFDLLTDRRRMEEELEALKGAL